MPDKVEKAGKEAKNAKNANKPPGKKRNKAVIVIVSVVAIVTVIGLAGYFIGRNLTENQITAQQNYVSYPTVTSNISSSRDGKNHTIDVDLVVEYEDGKMETISHDAAYKKMSETVGQLDYDEMRGFDSVEIIENSVYDGLSSMTGEDTVKKVYVSNIAIDFPGEVQSQSQSNNSSAGSFMQKARGLFNNLE